MLGSHLAILHCQKRRLAEMKMLALQDPEVVEANSSPSVGYASNDAVGPGLMFPTVVPALRTSSYCCADYEIPMQESRWGLENVRNSPLHWVIYSNVERRVMILHHTSNSPRH